MKLLGNTSEFSHPSKCSIRHRNADDIDFWISTTAHKQYTNLALALEIIRFQVWSRTMQKIQVNYGHMPDKYILRK